MWIGILLAEPLITPTFKANMEEMKSLSSPEREHLKEILEALEGYEKELESSSQPRSSVLDKVDAILPTFSSKQSLDTALDPFLENPEFKGLKDEYSVLFDKLKILQTASTECNARRQKIGTSIIADNLFAIESRILPEEVISKEEKAKKNEDLNKLFEVNFNETFDLDPRWAQWFNMRDNLKESMRTNKKYTETSAGATRGERDRDVAIEEDLKKGDAYFYEQMKKKIEQKLQDSVEFFKIADAIEDEIKKKILDDNKDLEALVTSFKVGKDIVKKWVELKLKESLYTAVIPAEGKIKTELAAKKERNKKSLAEPEKSLKIETGTSIKKGTLITAAEKQLVNIIPTLIKVAFDQELSSATFDKLPSKDDMIALNNKLSNAKYNAETNTLEVSVSGEKDKKELITDIDQEAIKVFIVAEIIRGFQNKKSELKRTEAGYKGAFEKVLGEVKSKYKNLFSQYIEQEPKMRVFVENLKEDMDSTWKDVERDKPEDRGVGQEWNDTVVPVVLQTMKPLFKATDLPKLFTQMPPSSFDDMYEKYIKGKGTSRRTFFQSEVTVSEERKKEEGESFVEKAFKGLTDKVQKDTTGGKEEEKPLGGLLDLFGTPEKK